MDKLRQSVIDQMMGELDDVTSESLKKKPGATKGVEISISVSPKTGDEIAEDMPEGEKCTDEDCEDPMHNHGATEEEGSGDYISQLLKKLG